MHGPRAKLGKGHMIRGLDISMILAQPALITVTRVWQSFLFLFHMSLKFGQVE